ncbi:MAG: hypothetical protein K2K31_00865, partial [Clostridia bacterium]|nr:hypothetical protein [Clostridia bacterium]
YELGMETESEHHKALRSQRKSIEFKMIKQQLLNAKKREYYSQKKNDGVDGSSTKITKSDKTKD